MTTIEEQLGRLFAEMEAEQAQITVAEIVGDPTLETRETVSTSSPRRVWMLVAAVFVTLAVGMAFVLAVRPGDDPAPVETPPVRSTAPTSTVPVVTDSIGGDHRSYFSVDDALGYLGPILIGDGPEPASRDEIAKLLAGGEEMQGTDTDVQPSLAFVTDPDDQDTDLLALQLLFPKCDAYNFQSFVDLDGGGGYATGLVGSFQSVADGGSLRPDWVYVDWYDDHLTYSEAKVLFDESVLRWILSRAYVFGRGYSGSKIAVVLSPEPDSPWNQAVIDHPFLRPAVIGDSIDETLCDTFVPMEPL